MAIRYIYIMYVLERHASYEYHLSSMRYQTIDIYVYVFFKGVFQCMTAAANTIEKH